MQIHTPCEFVTRLWFLILCIHDFKEAHRIKQRNENCVTITKSAYEFFLILWISLEEFLFFYANFPIS